MHPHNKRMHAIIHFTRTSYKQITHLLTLLYTRQHAILLYRVHTHAHTHQGPDNKNILITHNSLALSFTQTHTYTYTNKHEPVTFPTM